jgi:hypothetical protein
VGYVWLYFTVYCFGCRRDSKSEQELDDKPQNKMFMMKLYPRETSPQIQEHIYCDDSMLYEEFILFVYCLSCTLKIFSQKREKMYFSNFDI